jgi:hypothetical protein
VNFTLIGCIAMGVFTTYIGIAMLVTQLRGGRELPTPPPQPNFQSRETVTIDEKTGKKTIYREITVSTKLADPQ